MTSVYAKGRDTSVGWEMDLIYLNIIKKCNVFCAPGLWTEIYTTALISSCNDIIYRCILWIFPIVFHSILCLWWQAPFKTSVVILHHAPNVTLCTQWVFGKYWCVCSPEPPRTVVLTAGDLGTEEYHIPTPNYVTQHFYQSITFFVFATTEYCHSELCDVM